MVKQASPHFGIVPQKISVGDTCVYDLRSRRSRSGEQLSLAREDAMKVIAKGLVLLGCCCPAFSPGQITSFQHVIIVVQENRTPDNLFQGLCSAPFGRSTSCSTTPTGSQYDIQTTNWLDKTSSTGTTQPTTVTLDNTYDPSHTHLAFTDM
jgi:phospholipase C